jgi:hypothetical protein
MSQHLSVHLSDKDRQHLDSLLKKGNAPARVQTRARILLLADRSQGHKSQGHKRTGQQIAEAVLCCRLTVSQICRRFAQEGLESALYEKPRPGQTPKITGEIEAQLVMAACSSPPKGHKRWTLKLLADKLVQMELVKSISEVAVYKRLKKRAQALEGQVLVHCR